MPGNHSKARKRVERISVNDDPHERYQKLEPYTGKELSRGIPLLSNTTIGHIVEKEVTHYNIECPECGIPARYSHKSEPQCPRCGIICSGKHGIENEVVIDAKAAGRLDGQQEESET